MKMKRQNLELPLGIIYVQEARGGDHFAIHMTQHKIYIIWSAMWRGHRDGVVFKVEGGPTAKP